jgi:hypothetical protein
MSGIYFGVFVVAVLLVIHWSMTSEQAGIDGAMGLFAMTARRKKRRSGPKRGTSRFSRKEPNQ